MPHPGSSLTKYLKMIPVVRWHTGELPLPSFSHFGEPVLVMKTFSWDGIISNRQQQGMSPIMNNCLSVLQSNFTATLNLLNSKPGSIDGQTSWKRHLKHLPGIRISPHSMDSHC